MEVEDSIYSTPVPLNTSLPRHAKISTDGESYSYIQEESFEQIPWSLLEKFLPPQILKTLDEKEGKWIHQRCTLDEHILRKQFHNTAEASPLTEEEMGKVESSPFNPIFLSNPYTTVELRAQLSKEEEGGHDRKRAR